MENLNEIGAVEQESKDLADNNSKEEIQEETKEETKEELKEEMISFENTVKQDSVTNDKQLHQAPIIRISSQPDDSQNQQWVYLTLLQQQIDILRTQMMHLLNKENNLNKVSVSTNTEPIKNQDFGTHTSFMVQLSEKVCKYFLIF